MNLSLLAAGDIFHNDKRILAIQGSLKYRPRAFLGKKKNN
jgi:hypothetical protein